jgi:hypothetical protein
VRKHQGHRGRKGTIGKCEVGGGYYGVKESINPTQYIRN